MKKITKTIISLATLATVCTGAYIANDLKNQEKAHNTEIPTEKLLKVSSSIAVTKNVEDDTIVEDTENYYASSTETDTETETETESDNTQTMNSGKGYANAMTVDPSQIGVGVGGSGFKDGTYFQILCSEKVGVNGFSFYVISHATGDCIKVTCSSDNYQKAFAFADYMNELAPNGKTNNGLKSNFDYYMNN